MNHNLNDPTATPLQSGPQVNFDIAAPSSADEVVIPEELYNPNNGPKCPAAAAFSDQASYPACVCRIDNSIVSAKTSPRNYEDWCVTNYEACPAWRMKRERELAEKYKQEQYRY